MRPIRCYTCNGVIGHIVHFEDVKRMCCRRMLMTYVEFTSENPISHPNVDVVLDKGGTRMHRQCHHENEVSCE